MNPGARLAAAVAIAAVAAALFAVTCTAQQSVGGKKRMPYAAKELSVMVSDRPVVLLEAEAADQNKPAIIAAEVLPGRGMNIVQLRAHVPGRGVVEMLASPAQAEYAKTLTGDTDDPVANKTFGMGAPILLPWANRIRGKVTADGKGIETTVAGKRVTLLSNGAIKKPGDEPHAIHGFMMARRMDKFTTSATADQSSVTGEVNAGDFNGRWPSKTYATITVRLRDGKFFLDVTAKNTGSEPLPVGIGWHPFFAIPSGRRAQARIRIPARTRVLTNNYDEAFPTGKLEPVRGTKFDFTAGAELGDLYIDDCFVDVEKSPQGHVAAEMIDPASKYGLRIRSTSPQVTALQVFSPTARQLVAMEPQFNWADPYSDIWKGKNTGMVTLQPGETVKYSVEVELFIPN
jgi:aldose 1-epimerase